MRADCEFGKEYSPRQSDKYDQFFYNGVPSNYRKSMSYGEYVCNKKSSTPTQTIEQKKKELREEIEKLQDRIATIKKEKYEITEKLTSEQSKCCDLQTMNRQLTKENKELREEQEAINEHFRRFDLLDL